MLKLQGFSIKGERCSGTNFLRKLVETNLKIEYLDAVDWKHGFYTASIHRDQDLTKYISPETFATLIIFRNPFDWLRSLYTRPHQFEGTANVPSAGGVRWLTPITFSEFIRKSMNNASGIANDKFHSYHPFYFTQPKNILELRKWKIEHFLGLKNVLPYTYYMKYEDLAQDPERIITEINNKFFNIDFEFKNWTNYKANTNRPFVPAKYFDISDDDYQFLLENIDWELEAKIGYDTTIPERGSL